MIVRKTYEADIDRRRPRVFAAALLCVTAVFAAALYIRLPDVADIIADIADDTSVDIELAPLPEQDRNLIAAPVREKTVTERIRKVDETTASERQEAVRQDLAFTTSADPEAEKMKAEEAKPIAPAITDMEGADLPLRVIEELPEFPGGMSEYVQWLTQALRYPQSARQRKQAGEIVVKFVVEKDGTISHLRFVKQTHTALDAEVLRVMRIMPKWKPGKDHGRPCRAVVAVPVVFAM